MGFLFLLLVTVLFASGALFITYQLGNIKTELNRQLESRLGGNLDFDAVSISSIRGLKITALNVVLPFEHGPSMTLTVPEALVRVNLLGLLQGTAALDRLTLDDAVIEIERPLDSAWYAEGTPTLRIDAEASSTFSEVPFRIQGKNATLRVKNIVQESSAVLGNIDFMIARQTGSEEIAATVNGNLSPDPRKRLTVKASYESVDDFNVRLDQSSLSPEDVLVLFPSDTPLVLSGEISPSVRIYGGPHGVVILNLQAPFENAQVQDQPDFVEPATGDLTVLASYNTLTQELNITTAKIESEQIAGTIDGSIQFANQYPEFDLELLCKQLPIQDMLESMLYEQADEYGTLEFVLDPAQQLVITLEGTSDAPVVRSEARSNGGTLVFTPGNDQYPPVELTLGTIRGSWDSNNEEARGSIDILDGKIVHDESNLSASAIRGTLVLADNKLTLNPVNAVITKNNFVGSFLYDLDTEDATIALNGTVQKLENTSYRDAIKNINLGGALNLKTELRKRGKEYFLDAQVEASQTQLDYMWWFKKPPGVGATGFIHGHFVPEKSYQFDFDADLASSQLTATIRGEYSKKDKAFHLMKAVLSSNYLDITTVGSCITLPYKITGSTGGYGYVDFELDPENTEYSRQKFGVFINRANLLPISENAREPMRFESAAIEVDITNSDVNTGSITLRSKTVNVPPFSSTWFVALSPPEEYASRDRDWAYSVSAKQMTLPPWVGHDFSGEGYSTPSAVGFTTFDVGIEAGTMAGSYHAIRAENSYKTSIDWNSVPIQYFLKHFDYEDILTGTTDGKIDYGLDKDDPGTLDGNGQFEIRDGQFSADFLYSLVGGSDGEGLASLPPRLEFSKLQSSVTLASDIVRTPDFRLESEGLLVEGKGQYVREGDLDYVIKVKVSPAMAESIPSMRDSLNLQGYKVSGQDIELAFNVVGPTFGPKGELAELPPASVTLVTGAGELLREGINVIDTPRRMLVGLMKTIGGAVGAGASN